MLVTGPAISPAGTHPYGVARRDIETCRAVRKAVGDTMELMLDPVNSYTRREAATVAAALEELDFYWFEAPIPDSDIDGLRDLTRSFRIPIAGAEYVNLGIKAYPQYLNNPACDIMRGIGDWIGGELRSPSVVEDTVVVTLRLDALERLADGRMQATVSSIMTNQYGREVSRSTASCELMDP